MAPEPTDFTEVVNTRLGSIRARGHLTVQAADLLCGAVEALHGVGHTRVLLDLRGVEAADDAGLAMLRDLQTTLSARSHTLLVLHPPVPGGGEVEELTVPRRA